MYLDAFLPAKTSEAPRCVCSLYRPAHHTNCLFPLHTSTPYQLSVPYKHQHTTPTVCTLYRPAHHTNCLFPLQTSTPHQLSVPSTHQHTTPTNYICWNPHSTKPNVTCTFQETYLQTFYLFLLIQHMTHTHNNILMFLSLKRVVSRKNSNKTKTYIYCENKLVVNFWNPITCFNISM